MSIFVVSSSDCVSSVFTFLEQKKSHFSHLKLAAFFGAFFNLGVNKFYG
jgi:hypothetical protein